MTLRISISSITEAMLRERALASGQPVEAIAARIVEEAVQRAGHPAATQGNTSGDLKRRLASLRRWATMGRPAGHAIDDSRESICAGRGE